MTDNNIVVELARLRAENAMLREFAEELAYAGVEFDARKYITIQVDPETKAAAYAFFQAEKAEEVGDD